MKRTCLFLVLFAGLSPLFGQSSLPPYYVVMSEFFSKYEYEKSFEKQIAFAKKNDGWHVQFVNQYDSANIEEDLLFWSLEKKEFIPLSDLEIKKNNSTPETLIYNYLDDISGYYDLYGYERCRYYGYNGWDADMIRDFKDLPNPGDTLLEGLGRAYAFFAERYLWYGFGGRPLDNDPLKSKLEKLETPSKERIREFLKNIELSIRYYKKLDISNPRYRTIVGTPKMKVLNEYFHIYQQLLIAGLTQEAKTFINKSDDYPTFKHIGYNYLNACPPNAILVTFGDNDTYPLWYVQEKEGFRKDVTVLNYSMLGFAPYVNMLKKNKILSFSTPVDFYGSVKFDYTPFQEQDSIPRDTELQPHEFIRLIHTSRYPYTTYNNDTISSYPTKTLIWELDPAKLKKISGIDMPSSFMLIELTDYLSGNDLMILDIATTNFYNRPICFTSQAPLFKPDNQKPQKFIYRLLPFDANEASKDKTINDDIAYISTSYKPLFTHSSKTETFYADNSDAKHDDLYMRIISHFLEKEDTSTARVWTRKYLDSFKGYEIPMSHSKIDAGKLLFKTGFTKEATAILESYAEHFVKYYRTFSSLELNSTKEGTLEVLDQLLEIFKENNLESRKIGQLVEKVKSMD